MADSPSLEIASLAQMKVVDLRKELDLRGLEKSGLKADLVKRLETVSFSTLFLNNTKRYVQYPTKVAILVTITGRKKIPS